ncbi:MAG: site-specific integrase [Henriciella sp.]
MNRSIPDTLLRNGIYQFKKRVPERLIATKTFDGKRFIQKSLKTRDPREARRLASDMDADFQGLCRRAEAELTTKATSVWNAALGGNRVPSEEDIQAELIRSRNSFLVATHRGFDTKNNAKWGYSDEDIYSGSPKYVWIEKLKSLAGAFRGQPDESTVDSVRRIVSSNGWSADEGTALFDELCERFAAAEIEAIETLLQSPRGDYHERYRVSASGAATSLYDALEHYKKIKGSRRQMLKKVETAVRAWDDLVGKPTISSITRADIRSFISELSKVPMTLRAKRPHDSLRQLIDHPSSTSPKEKRLAPRTIKDNYISPLSSAVKALGDDFSDVTNPFDRIQVDGATRKSKKRSFKDHELNAIFRHPIFTGCSGRNRRNTPGSTVIKDHYYWAPLIAMWTGMRAGEIANLALADVRISSQGYAGHPHFRIAEGKTENARREVPIHPILLKLGFDEYVAKIASEGHARLFPDWKQPKGKLLSSGASQKNFNSKVLSCCDDDDVSFHTFRHTMKNVMAKARIAEQYQRAILGHEKLGIDANYFHPELDHYYDEFVQKIEYPNVDLSHLYK